MDAKIEELAKIIMTGDVFNLPIDTIDGVQVNCHIVMLYQSCINRTDLIIGAHNPFVPEDDETSCRMKLTVWRENTKLVDLTVSDVIEMFNELIVKLASVKYDKIEGLIPDIGNDCIVKRELKISQLSREIFNLPNIQMKYHNNICCVCHDITSDVTRCNHDLCLQCLYKLPLTEPPDNKGWEEGQKGKSCPICRGFMFQYN